MIITLAYVSVLLMLLLPISNVLPQTIRLQLLSCICFEFRFKLVSLQVYNKTIHQGSVSLCAID
jgi:hypothetical protein